MLRFLLILLFLSLPAEAYALAGDWARDDATAIRLISGTDAVGTDTTVQLGLEVQLADGWHTYWRSPGEAGLPPQLDWSRSQTDDNNLQAATLQYPAPRRYAAYGLETIGYRDHVVFPIDATLRKAGQALNADMSIDILVCSSICVPKHFDLKLAVPVGSANASEEAALLHQARAQLPSDSENAGILLKSVTSDGQNLTFSITSRDALTQPDVFVENDKEIGFGAPTVKMDSSGSATLTVKLLDNLADGQSLTDLPLTLTFVDGDHAIEIKTKAPAPTSAPPEIAPQKPHFSLALLFALIGGFILNLMPCVLPVLSLKILGLVCHGGGDVRKVRQSFLMTAAGILFSFFVLACTMVALKRLGLALGWGVQFQQPAFLMFLVLLLTFFAANLWGLFEIPLPRFLADTLGTACALPQKNEPLDADKIRERFFEKPPTQKAAQENAYRPKLAGDFATGAFATLLATPCSAPFLGTAVGFALASGPVEIFAIFIALGLGMATPYLAVALFPRSATLLPKPGKWMIRLRQFLGLALVYTALWLIWVMAAQITPAYALTFGLLMASITLLLVLGKYGLPNKVMLAGIALLCVGALALGLNGALKPKAPPLMDKQWMSFDQNALNADIAEGKTVFLDVTADWCLTCKANMKFTLSHADIIQRLFHTDIIAMQADWTNPDPVVIDLLHKYGRYGIPFNIVYGPAAPEGIVLPELLTPSLVLEALDKASATSGGQASR